MESDQNRPSSEASPSAPAEPLSDRIPFLLQRAVEDAQAMGERALAALGVTGREYGVLALLASSTHPTQRHLGGALGLDRTTTTAVLTGLERRGLIERPPDPRNRRANAVTLTTAGEDARARAAEVLVECEQRFLLPLAPAERSALHAVLLKLTQPTVVEARPSSPR